MADYYQGLSSFAGTNTIVDQLPSGWQPLIRTIPFAFVRPNKLRLGGGGTNDELFVCDGEHFWDYKPWYFESYTVLAAPLRFEDAITNWVGGEIVRVILDTNRYNYVQHGFSPGATAMRYVGEEPVNGHISYHIFMEQSRGGTAELWIAKGDSPYITKLVMTSLTRVPTNGVAIHTETISGWKTNTDFTSEQFGFTPAPGMIEHPPGADAIETTLDTRTGRPSTRFYNPSSGSNATSATLHE